ncbi:MAG: ABC transporter ATP-binding protein [Treponema sp.]|nr:ABC transporter ATP-binding protein [Treponema sp.]
MINIQNITKRIKNKIVFEDISLQIKKQETYVLVGPNGIGKTSLLKSILGLYLTDTGSITVLGQKVSNSYTINSNIGVFLDTAKMLPHSKLNNSLEFFTSLYNKSIEDIQYLIDYLHLENELDKTYISLSSGNKRKVGLLISLINNPELLIWDEPFATLDPEMCKELVDFIIFLKQSKKTILITTNDLFYVNNLFDRIGFFVNSNTIIEKSNLELITLFPDKNINEIYFLIKQTI